jgi:flavin-dependent dehydrogenase
VKRVDLLVAGGGPAGSTLAALAAAAGARTLVVEKAAFPRDKVCGEFVSAAGCGVLERLGVLPRLLAAGAARMDSFRVTEPRGAALDAGLAEAAGAALGISRARLDAALLDEASRRGAEVRDRCEAVAPLFVAGRVAGMRVRRVGSDAVETVRAALVVAADGRRSALGRRLHPRLGDPRRTGAASWFGLRAHFATAAPGRVDLHLFDGGYAGLAPVEGGRSNLCLLATAGALRSCAGSPDRLLAERARRNPALDRAIGAARRCGPWNSVGPLRFAPRRPTAAGALFVGDAAGTIDPFCGAGIAHALRGAEIALPFVLQALHRGRLTAPLARGYRRSWSAAFAAPTRRARRLGRVFERPRLARAALVLLGGAASGWVPRLVAATRTGAGRG